MTREVIHLAEKLVEWTARGVQKLSFTTSQSHSRWQNGSTGTTMLLSLEQRQLLKLILWMCTHWGVFRAAEPVTSVDAKFGLSDAGLAAGILTQAEVARWYLRIYFNGGSEQRSQIDKSCNRENDRYRDRVFPGYKSARAWTALNVHLR